MKILHIAGGGDVGGAKTHILNLVQQLGRFADIKLISLRPGPFNDEALSMDIDAEVIKTGNIFKDIRSLAEIIRSGKYDIIHSHGAKANMYSVMAAKLVIGGGIPLATTVHSDYRLDYMHSFKKRISFGLINIIALRFLDYHIAVSRNFREMLIRRRFNPENIFTLYNGIDFGKKTGSYTRDEFYKKYKLDFGKEDIIVGLLGRLHPVKGQDTLVKAAEIVAAKYPEVRFVLGGEGEYRRSLEKKIRSRGLEKNMILPGWVDNPYEFMDCIDINVLTSLSETFPYVILEGAMYGRATISTDVGGISDLIRDCANGFLIKPGDHKLLASRIIQLAADRALREQMGRELRQDAENGFSLENMFRTQLQIYDRIIADKSAGLYGRKDYDAIISGYYGFSNIGDDAMLQSIIKDIRKSRSNTKMLILSRNPAEAELYLNINSAGRYNLPRILMAMRKSRLLVYGGGTLIQDSTSTRSLIYYLSIIWIAKKMGLKVMLYANGFEPMSRHMNRRLTHRIINQIDMITLREQSSLVELEKLGITKPQTIITADAALSLDAPAPAHDHEAVRILKARSVAADKPLVGISVRKWQGMDTYTEIIASAADHIAEELGAAPVFLAMQYPDDYAAIEAVTGKMRQKAHVITEKLGVAEMLSLIERMDMLIGMRLHSLVFAASLSVPVIGIPYQPKVQAFLDHIGQGRCSVGDMGCLDRNRFIGLIDSVWQDRKKIKSELSEIIPVFKKKAAENAAIAAMLMEKPAAGGG